MAWQYQREENNSYKTRISEGPHRIRIADAEKKTSKKGNDMLVLKFDVSGYENESIYHYITFMQENVEMTNRMLTSFFDAFPGIPEGDFDTSHWIGKTGACVVKHDEYNGSVNARVRYFLSGKKAEELPPWEGGEAATGTGEPAEFSYAGDEDLPF